MLARVVTKRTGASARVNELLSSNDAERAIAESLEWATPNTWDERARHIVAWAEKR
jgi:hypothetical protein